VSIENPILIFLPVVPPAGPLLFAGPFPPAHEIENKTEARRNPRITHFVI
jgi:hypothetical protein